MRYDAKKNYVGPQGKWYSILIPRKPLGIDLNYPAYNHDRSYFLGLNKRVSDLTFLYDCMALAESNNWKLLPNPLMRFFARFVILFYYIFIRVFGKNYYIDIEKKG